MGEFSVSNLDPQAQAIVASQLLGRGLARVEATELHDLAVDDLDKTDLYGAETAGMRDDVRGDALAALHG